MERDERLCLKLVGLQGLEEARMQALKRRLNGDTREWLPLFDCCYRRCKRKGTVMWRWRWKRLFFCTVCAEVCKEEHKMEMEWKGYKVGTTSIWGLNWDREEDEDWLRSNAKLLGDLGVENNNEAWL